MRSSLHVTFVVTPRIARFRRRIVEKLQLTRPPNLGKGRIDKPRAGMLPNRFEPMSRRGNGRCSLWQSSLRKQSGEARPTEMIRPPILEGGARAKVEA
jgi:hypothetical protein